MLKKITALCVALALPCAASAETLKEAAERAAKELAVQRDVERPGRTRFWTGIALLAGGGALTTLGATEFIDDEDGPDDAEDVDGSDDGEDSDGWGNKAMIGGGVAAAALGGVLLFTGRRSAGPSVSIKPGRVSIRHTLRF